METVKVVITAPCAMRGGARYNPGERAAFEPAVARQLLDPQALLTVFGEADQVLEMPYKLAKINWEENAQQNPWPPYNAARALLQNKLVLVRARNVPGGIEVYARTPLTLYGMLEAFRRTFDEAGF